MRRSRVLGTGLLAFAFLVHAGAAAAQESLKDQQFLGMRLYNQSCRVCHAKPQPTSPQYAPVLSRISMNGSGEALRTTIAEGSAKMPGFKYHFKPAEIDAIVAYLKTVPPPAD
ncbi:MAG TPA: cytochrome c [Burkholderiales bacterium]|nr:cytochrome c [Burkholderiales bacterium]